MTVLWLDDIRDPKDFNINTDGWLWAKNPKEFEEILKTAHRDITEIHFDNDLGDLHIEGYNLFCGVEGMLFCGQMDNLDTIYVHTANPSAKKRFESAIGIFKEAYGVDVIMRHL